MSPIIVCFNKMKTTVKYKDTQACVTVKIQQGTFVLYLHLSVKNTEPKPESLKLQPLAQQLANNANKDIRNTLLFVKKYLPADK